MPGACGDTHTSVVRERVQVQSEQDLGALSISILVALVRCVESGWVQACLCVSYIRILSDPYHQIDARPRLLNPNRFITPSTSKSFLPFPYTHLHTHTHSLSLSLS